MLLDIPVSRGPRSFHTARPDRPGTSEMANANHRVFASSQAQVDQILARPYSAEVLMGCVGDRVWAVSPQGWGFGEGVQLLHLQTNINAFDLEIRGGDEVLEVGEARYVPSQIQMRSEERSHNESLRVRGDKWISGNDVLVPRLYLTNTALPHKPFSVRMDSGLEERDGGFAASFDMGGDLALHLIGIGFDGNDYGTRFSGELAPGEKRVFTFACAVGADLNEANEGLKFVFGDGDPLASHMAVTQQWHDTNTAHFACSDRLVSKMYWHRWYLLRKCSLFPRLGAMQHRTFCEGRWKSPWYPYTISYGAPHQIRESRWLRDPSYVWGHIQTWTENTRADSVFPGRIAPEGELGWQYTEWIASTAWDAYRVHPERDILSRSIDALARRPGKRFTAGTTRRFWWSTNISGRAWSGSPRFSPSATTAPQAATANGARATRCGASASSGAS